MLRIAHFSPLPPQRSGIATYCAELLPHLAERMSVDVYVDDASSVDDTLARAFNIRSIVEFLHSPRLRRQIDVCVYHMGNHPDYHASIYTAMMCSPGITVLHEIDLYAFHLNRGEVAFVREMGYSDGLIGTRAARRARAGPVGLSDKHPLLFRRVADVSLGLIVHTPYARRRVLAESPRARVTCIPLAVSLPSAPESIRRPGVFDRFPPETIVIGSFGYLAPSKRIDVVLRALAQLCGEVAVRYLLVGEPIPAYDVKSLIVDLGLSDVVQQTGFVDDQSFQTYLTGIDIGVNLRTAPTGGEMSATLMRLMASGKPIVVSETGGFAAMPDDCVVKIRQDESEVDRLAAALRRLAQEPGLRAAYGAAARRYVQHEFSFSRVTADYAAFIQESVESAVSGRLWRA